MDANLSYLLVEANRLRVGGYNEVPMRFINVMLDYLYSDNPKAQVGLLKKYTDASYFDLKQERWVSVAFPLGSPRQSLSYLGTYQNNSNLRAIYMMSKTNPMYKELSFVLFLLGAVNSLDYLRFNTDVGFVIGKFAVGVAACRENSDAVVTRVPATDADYRTMMGMYFENAAYGVDYGFSPFDFIYHMLNTLKGDNQKPHYETYKRVISLIKGLHIDDYSKLHIDESILRKYPEEVGVCLPAMSGRVNTGLLFKYVDYVTALYKGNGLATAILRDYDFIAFVEKQAYSIAK